jgi:diacylglycerol O-acyltransferase
MDRMSPQDASFLHIEGDVNHMHIASVAVFEGPPPTIEDLRAMVAAKLPIVPRYRQKVRTVPLDFARPVWVDDPHFHLDYHVRHTGLPSPGTEDQLKTLVGRVMSQQLDRSKPLWEMWMVEGLGDDEHWALFSKTHHCMVDGVAGTDLLTVVLDREPEPERATPPPWDPEPEPDNMRLLRDAVVDRVTNPYETFRAMRAAGRPWREVLKGTQALASLARPTPPTVLNGPIGPHRSWSWARSSLADVKTVRTGLGGTVNDVVLTAITRGFRDFLVHRGEDVDAAEIRTLVPVSVRTKAPGPAVGDGTYNNKVSAMFATLPVAIADPAERLQAIRDQMEGLKESKQAIAGEALTAMSGFAPPMMLAMATRMATRLPQRNVNTVTTNVPGPQFPLYACGRKMIEAFPYVPLAGSVRIGVAIFSYNGRINFGVTADSDTIPDVQVLCDGIEAGMAELVKLASG